MTRASPTSEASSLAQLASPSSSAKGLNVLWALFLPTVECLKETASLFMLTPKSSTEPRPSCLQTELDHNEGLLRQKKKAPIGQEFHNSKGRQRS